MKKLTSNLEKFIGDSIELEEFKVSLSKIEEFLNHNFYKTQSNINKYDFGRIISYVIEFELWSTVI